MDDLIKDLQKIKITKQDTKGNVLLTEEFEDVLYKIRSAEKIIAELKERAKSELLDVMKNRMKLKKYEGRKVTVGYRSVRRKQISGDPDEDFYIVEKKPNTRAIDSYRNATGKLPTGISEKIFEYVTFNNIKIDEEIKS